MEALSIFKHVGGLFSSPVKAMAEVKAAGWVTPLLCVSAAVGGICNLPWRTPEMLLHALKVWGVLQVLGISVLWLAGLPQGGRGSIAACIKVAGLLTIIDGLAWFYIQRFLPPLLPMVNASLPVLFFLAVKAVHEYENDGMAFRVTTSAFFLFLIGWLRIMPYLGVG